MKTLFDRPARLTAKQKIAALWNANLDLKAALKKARIENRNLKRLLKVRMP